MFGACGAVITAVLGGAALYDVPYYTVSPGSVWPTEDLIQVRGDSSYESAGEIGFTTVSLSEERTSALEAFLGWLDPAVELVDEEVVLGDQTPEQNRQRNLEYMVDSKVTATAVALETLGYDVARTYGARVVRAAPDTPAASILSAGDLIVAVDDQPVTSWSDLTDLLGAKQPGDEVSLEIVTAGEQTGTSTDDPSGELVPTGPLPFDPRWETETVSATMAERYDDPSTDADDDFPAAILGIEGEDAVELADFPFEVDIDSGAVGGPSAGLAFTLAVLDVLTEEDLTGGALVATTGTMDLAGNVGPVGGVSQKVIAARRAGVELFLVPSAEYDEARAVAGDMRIVRVDTLEQALAALETVGGDTQALQAAAAESFPQ